MLIVSVQIGSDGSKADKAAAQTTSAYGGFRATHDLNKILNFEPTGLSLMGRPSMQSAVGNYTPKILVHLRSRVLFNDKIDLRGASAI